MIQKEFSDIGTVVYKAASTKEEYEQALKLVYHEYLSRGYILKKYYKSELRLSIQNALRDTAVFIGLKDGEVVCSVTLMPDSPLGLPMDVKYQKESDGLRGENRKICEVGQLAMRGDIFGQKLFSMFNFNKLSFMFTLFKMAFQYACFHLCLQDLLIVTNPKLMIFQFLPFEEIGPVKYYGYDRIAVKKKAAVAKRLDLTRVDDVAVKRVALKKMYLDDRIPDEVFGGRYRMSKEDFYDLFCEKSDIFREASEAQRKYLIDYYRLTEADISSC